MSNELIILRRYTCVSCNHSSCDLDEFDPLYPEELVHKEWICRECAQDIVHDLRNDNAEEPYNEED